MKLQFPSVDNEVIDTVLGGSWDNAKQEGEGWAESGAFEKWKSKQYKSEKPRQFEIESGVWQWLATDEAQSLSDEERKQENQCG